MTSLPANRPAIPMPRPGAPAAPHAHAAPAIDPIRLLKKYKWPLLIAAGVGLVLGTVLNYVLLYAYPVYTASIYYECFPLEDTSGSGRLAPGNEDELKRFMATQLQVLNSDKIIDKAVGDPRLPRDAPQWSRQYTVGAALDTQLAARDLKKSLSAGVLGESNFIRLSFWCHSRDESAAVAKVVGRAYERDRQQSASGDLSDRKKLLSDSVTEMTAQITRIQDTRKRLLQDEKVESLDERLDENNRNISTIMQKLIDLRADREAITVHRDKLKNELEAPSGPQYPEAMRKRVEEESSILRLKDEINLLESGLASARKRFAEEHRTVVQIRQRLEGVQIQLNAEKQRQLRQLFDAQLEELTTSIASLDAQEADYLKKLEEGKVRAAELTQTLSKVRDMNRDMDRLTETRSRIQEDLQRLDLGTRANRVYLYQDAQVPRGASFPQLKIMVPLSMILAVGAVLGVVVLIEVVDQRVKGPADIAMLRTRVLGLVPHAGEDPGVPQRVETVFRDLPGGVLAESYRKLREEVLKRMEQGGHKSLLVMSGMPGSGATSVASNLACAAAASQQRVLLIDANFRRPAVHRVFGLKEVPGLADVLAGTVPLAEATQEAGTPNLKVLGAGSSEQRAFERLTNSPMSELLRQASEAYDLVIVDVAPALVAGDALALAHRCDATLLVVRAMSEKRGLVARLRSELAETKTDFLGVLVNAARSAAGGYLRGNILASHRYQNGKDKE